eukprot:gene12485-biopygen9044
MFPWSDHVLRELNTKMLDAVSETEAQMEGGDFPYPSNEKLRSMFAPEGSVLRGVAVLEGGGGPLPVRDANGQPVNYYVDVQEIENACNAISHAYKSNDDRLYEHIQKLDAKVEELKRRRPGVQKVQHVHHYEAPFDEYGQPRRGRTTTRGRGGRVGTAEVSRHYSTRMRSTQKTGKPRCITASAGQTQQQKEATRRKPDQG